MSFRSFVYWCAVCGGWAAAVGWGLGWLIVRNEAVAGTGIKGMFVGMLIALGLGIVDAAWVYSLRQLRRAAPRVLVCAAVGNVGGLLGGVVGQLLFDWKDLAGLLVFGWVLTGLMVGASIGTYDLLRSWVREDELSWACWRLIRGLVGGAVGGLLGGTLDWTMGNAWVHLFRGKSDLWTPSLTGFVVLGLCIGLLIGVARIALTEAWLKVEEGFRRGRELLLDQPVLTIGRAESCDLGLFGDAAIGKLHARIYQEGGRHLIADAGSATGTFVNDQRVLEPTLLRSGDLIRVGSAYLRFSQRRSQT
jgi:hypothetical protein